MVYNRKSNLKMDDFGGIYMVNRKSTPKMDDFEDIPILGNPPHINHTSSSSQLRRQIGGSKPNLGRRFAAKFSRHGRPSSSKDQRWNVAGCSGSICLIPPYGGFQLVMGVPLDRWMVFVNGKILVKLG